MKNIVITLFVCLLWAIVPVFASAQLPSSPFEDHPTFETGSTYNPSASSAAPSGSFRSTSTGIPSSSTPAVGFGRITSIPTISSSGTASNPFASPGPRKGREPGSSGGNGGTPGSEAGNQIPVGGPVLPLLLLAVGYMVFALRRSASKQ